MQHLESGRRIDFNATVRFPMGSVFKIPIAARVLSLVDSGLVALDQTLPVLASDQSPGSGIIQSLLYKPGLCLSLENLLELALVVSDNTANDVLLRLVGGPAAVTQFLRANQIQGIRIDRLTKQILADKYGLAGLGENGAWSLESYDAGLQGLTAEEMQRAAARFAQDDRDTMTPAAMVELLGKISMTDLLTLSSRTLFLSIMERCRTGEGALKGMLPPGTVVAHKTGSLIGVVANDVGIITLPGEAGHLAIAVCVQSSETKSESESSSLCWRIIAHVARAAYDYFLFHA